MWLKEPPFMLPNELTHHQPNLMSREWRRAGGRGRPGGGGELWHLIECYKVPPFLTDYVKSLWKAFSCVPNAWEVDEASTATVFVFHQIALWVWRLEQLAERQWRAFEAVLNLTWQQSVTHCWLNTLTTTATDQCHDVGRLSRGRLMFSIKLELWLNQLARSLVNWEVAGLSPPRENTQICSSYHACLTWGWSWVWAPQDPHT